MVDQSVECNLIYEIGIECLNSLEPNTNRLCRELDQALRDHMKKLINELIEFDSKRNELFAIMNQLDKNIDERTRPKSGMFKFVSINMNRDQAKLSIKELNELKSKFEQQMVDLSNIFLNEKIDLMIQHDQEVNVLNEEINRLQIELNKLTVNKIEKRQSFKVSTSKINRYVQTEEELSVSDKEQEKIELVKLDVNINTDEKFDTLNSKVKEKIEKFEQNLKADNDKKPIANIIYDSNEKEMESKVSLINIKSLFFISS